jgi:hypothetical protein
VNIFPKSERRRLGFSVGNEAAGDWNLSAEKVRIAQAGFSASYCIQFETRHSYALVMCVKERSVLIRLRVNGKEEERDSNREREEEEKSTPFPC